MQFKPQMIEAIKAGRKTQTRRPVKPGERLGESLPGRLGVFDSRGHAKWTEGFRYYMCPGRGKIGVGLIRLLHIRQETIGAISDEDARAEGFADREVFLRAWKALYPKSDLGEAVWVLEFDLN